MGFGKRAEMETAKAGSRITIKNRYRTIMPETVEFIGAFVLRCLRPYNEFDSSTYWRKRSREEGQKAVLWRNQDYNHLYRERQKEILRPIVSDLDKNSSLLDIGCGTGIVTAIW